LGSTYGIRLQFYNHGKHNLCVIISRQKHADKNENTGNNTNRKKAMVIPIAVVPTSASMISESIITGIALQKFWIYSKREYAIPVALVK
jgi:hypothetical protein